MQKSIHHCAVFLLFLLSGCLHYTEFSDYLPLGADPEQFIQADGRIVIEPIPGFIRLQSHRADNRYYFQAVFDPSSIEEPLLIDRNFLRLSSSKDTFQLINLMAVYDEHDVSQQVQTPGDGDQYFLLPNQKDLPIFTFRSEKKYSFRDYRQSFEQDTLFLSRQLGPDHDTLYRLAGYIFNQKRFP